MLATQTTHKTGEDLMLKNILIVISVSIILSACVNPNYAKMATPINLLPMYGFPDIKKTDHQIEGDKRLLETEMARTGSLEKSAKEFVSLAWGKYQNNDLNGAMRRFNQAWLLDPNYYKTHWGFGMIDFQKNRPDKAIIHLDKAISLLNDRKENPELLAFTASAYGWNGDAIKKTSPLDSKKLLNKAASLISESLDLDPTSGSSYSIGVYIYSYQGNYKKAWELVKKARVVANYKFDSQLLDMLSKEMPEPK